MLDGFSAEERERFAGYLSRAYRNLRGQKKGGRFMTDLETSSAVPGTLSERYGHRRLAGGD